MSFDNRSRQVSKREEEEARKLAEESTAPEDSAVPAPAVEPVLSSNLDPGDLLAEPKPRRLQKIIVVSIVVLVILVLIGSFIYGLCTTPDKAHYWAVTGDTILSLSGIITALSAWVAWKTNRARSRQVSEREEREEEEEARKLAEESTAPEDSAVPAPAVEPVISSNLDPGDLLAEPKPRRLQKIIVVSIVVLVILALIGSFIYGLCTTGDKTHYWAVTGDTIRNLSGVIVVLGAWVAWETNRARSHEAEKSDFRDRMRWAVENSDHENEQIAEYAAAVIRSFGAKTQARWMSEEDQIFIRKAVQTSQEHREGRDWVIRSVRLWVDEAENELGQSVKTYGPLSQSSYRKLRVAKLKKVTHETEQPFKAVEDYIEALHEIIKIHEKEHKKDSL